jgi:hypothetical protein
MRGVMMTTDTTHKVTFTYRRYGTVYATDKHGNRIIHTNVITLWRDGEQVWWRRQYVAKDGTVSPTGITSKLASPSALEVARHIHFGCTGWSANAVDLHLLTERVKEFMGQQF